VTSVASAERGGTAWRLWALLPLALLVGIVALFGATGGSVVDLLGRTPPQADEFDIRRVEFKPGRIEIRVTNPQQDDLTIAAVTVDEAIVPFQLDGPRTLERLRSSKILIDYDWVEDEPISVGVTSSTGIQTTEEIAAAVETPAPTASGFLGYGLIGLFVGIVPVALGMLWLPSLRRARPEWLAAFMALTGGLLTFLAFEALTESVELQATVPSALGGGLVLLGFSVSYLTLTFLSHRFSGEGGNLTGLALAMLVAIGIGVHNFGEGLAIGSSFALGELALGTFLIVGFMIHNVTEGLGIATPAAEEKRGVGIGRLVALVLIAGSPTIVGAWLGGFVRSDLLGVVFFAAAAGAAFEVVIEVARYLRTRAPGGLTSGWVLGGFLAGIAVMYVTGLLVG
jgi:ZIP family zinc transporter